MLNKESLLNLAVKTCNRKRTLKRKAASNEYGDAAAEEPRETKMRKGVEGKRISQRCHKK